MNQQKISPRQTGQSNEPSFPAAKKFHFLQNDLIFDLARSILNTWNPYINLHRLSTPLHYIISIVSVTGEYLRNGGWQAAAQLWLSYDHVSGLTYHPAMYVWAIRSSPTKILFFER